MTDYPRIEVPGGHITILPEHHTRRYSARYGNYDSGEFYTLAAAVWWMDMTYTIWESRRRRNAA